MRNGQVSFSGTAFFILVAGALTFATFGVSVRAAEWTQWGGPNRNFMVDTQGLADKWPDDGPRKLWSRKLGDGYSTVVVEGNVLYTMYRTDDVEYTVALNAATGETLWEHENPSPFTQMMMQFGPGPSSTPVLAGDQLISIGTNMVMHCFDKKTGDVRWMHDLIEKFEAKMPGRGYCASPIVYDKTVIVPVGGDGQTLMAFKMSDGEVVWKNLDFAVAHSSPVMVEFEGATQLVLTASKNLISVNPANGELFWELPLKEGGAYLSSPLWTGDDLIFCSSAYQGGSHVFKLSKNGDKTSAEELWYGRKIRIHHGTPIRIGDHVYASSGDFGPAFLGAVNIHTGKVAWRERGFSKANFVYGDGKVIILDEDGNLALAKVSPEGVEVISKCKVTELYSWAAPTLAGTTLYVRDRKHIMALDLS